MIGKYIETPMGTMVAVGDEKTLRLLAFTDQKGLKEPVWTKGTSEVLESIEEELKSYFLGELKVFKTPLAFEGTPFQEKVWKSLAKVPYGTTVSYADLAKTVGKPTAFRAVAGANAANRFAIVLPCHRVINTGGKLGGYAGGLKRKEWLLEMERN
ncbi:MAG: Methylated-DNA--protein-cysteine methyltransferase [Chlamydiia bacterium]|nr:Methylated-DNA--protein-cysteine methyltransferase [Chlamydiia bacterium]MCH9615269.1 Methylated-DNA--protein-cysteine methyltransferase [Chlamydiia bacterium]MCH9628409.1 Methylated-DNA--protein-cysteine methyltransferase [Chlamydiia bacterium]